LIPIFDLDGTLLDSDAALVEPFVQLGVAREAITFGHALGPECQRLGIDMHEYLARYDTDAAQPFDGVVDLVAGLDRWAVCSNKHPRSGNAELTRLGWEPDVALFADAFAEGKSLVPVLERLDVVGEAVLFVGDTDHDRECALAVGARFAFAGWNSARRSRPGDVVLDHPRELLVLLDA
jgi:phosphoglycolate phosphatase-like HAD superfamily hydrolase